MKQPNVIVVASGPGPAVAVPDAGTVIAADGGLDRALALGLAVDVVIGDLDSVSDAALAAAEAAGTRVVRHPAAKDAADLELALDEAVALGARRVLVVASAEGRLDHLLASLELLAADRYAELELDAIVGDARIGVIRSERVLHGRPGELVSLIAIGGGAEGVTTAGLAYPLAGETLAAGSTRGVSNVFDDDEVRVQVGSGVLLAIRPGGAG